MAKKILFPVIHDIADIVLDVGNRDITHVGIHHSASSWGDAEAINDWHRQRGFKDRGGDGVFCGYNFIVNNGTRYPKGFIQLGRPVDRTPAAHRPKNTNSIAICVVGNYSEERVNTPYDPRFRALALLANHIRTELDVENMYFYGHRELTVPEGGTQCPGNYVDTNKMRQYFLDAYTKYDDTWRVWYKHHVLLWEDSKDRVSCLQRILNRYFGGRLVEDGVFGPLTKSVWTMTLGLQKIKSYQLAWEKTIRAIDHRGRISM